MCPVRSFAQGTSISAPQGGKPADFPAWCAAAQTAGLTNVLCDPFNATGNGAANDTTAIQRAISQTCSTGGGSVYLPCGTYMVAGTNVAATGALTINCPNITLEGENWGCTTIKFLPGTLDIRMISFGDSTGPGTDASHLVIKNLTLDGNGANWGASGGHNAIARGNTGTADHLLIDTVHFKNFYNAAITNTSVISIGGNEWSDLSLRHLTLENNRALGINLFCTAGTCGGFTIDDVKITNGTATGANPQQNVLVGTTVTGGGTIAHVVCTAPCSGVCVMDQASNVSIMNNTSNGCLQDQFVVSGGVPPRNVAVIGNTSINGGDGGFGFEATASQDGPSGCSFVGNTAKNNFSVGMFVLNGKNNNISGNVFDGNCTNPTPPFGCAGIEITGASGHTADANLLSNNQYVDSQGVPTQKYGVQLATAFTTNTRIDGGLFQANTVSDYRLDGALGTVITNYTGGSLSFANSPTYTVFGGRSTNAQLLSAATAPGVGSFVSCTDCTAATSPCVTGGVAGALAVRDSTPRWACR